MKLACRVEGNGKTNYVKKKRGGPYVFIEMGKRRTSQSIYRGREGKKGIDKSATTQRLRRVDSRKGEGEEKRKSRESKEL